MHFLISLNKSLRNNSPRKALWALLVCGLILIGAEAYGQTYAVPYLPKYQVLTVVYAPPGAASSVTYSNSESAGSTVSISAQATNTFNSAFTFGVEWNTPFSGGSITNTSSNGWETQTSGSNSISITSTQGNSVATAGPISSALGVNHDNDVIYILLNPVVNTTVNPTGSANPFSWVGLQSNSCDLTDSQFTPNVYQSVGGCDPNQYPFPDIVGIPVWCLKNPYYPGQSCLQWLPYTSRSWDTTVWPNGNKTGLQLGPGLTLQDYADILSADPFVTQTLVPPLNVGSYYCHPSYGLNVDPNDAETVSVVPSSGPPSGTWPSNFCGTPVNGTSQVTMQRFDAVDQVQYPQPGINGQPQTYSGTFTYSTTTGNSLSATNTSTVGNNFRVSAWGGFLGNGPSFGFDQSESWSWSSTNASSQTNGTSNTASYSITGPQASDNYQGPVTFNVYKDNVFGTFAFYSDLQREQPPLQLSGPTGGVVPSNGLVSSQSPILVSLTSSPTTYWTAGSAYAFTPTLTVCSPEPTCQISPDIVQITLTNNSPNRMTMVAPAVTFSDPGFEVIETDPQNHPDNCSNTVLTYVGDPNPQGLLTTCTLYIEFAPVPSDALNPLKNPNAVAASIIAAGTENISSYQNVLVTSTGLVVSGNAAPNSTSRVTITPATIQNASAPSLYAFPVAAGAQTQKFTVTNYYPSQVILPASPADFTLTDGVDFKITSDGCSQFTLAAATPPSGGNPGVATGTCNFTLQYLTAQPVPTTPATAGLFSTIITLNGTIAGQSGPTALTTAGVVGVPNAVYGISASAQSFTVDYEFNMVTGSGALTVTNHSNVSALTGVAVSLTSPTGQSGTWGYNLGTCSGSVAPLASCTGSITFTDSTACGTGMGGQTCTAGVTVTVTGTETGAGTVTASTSESAEVINDYPAAIRLVINGSEQTKSVTVPAKPGKAAVAVSGKVKTSFTGTRTVTLTVGGFKVEASYDDQATSATIAKALAAAANVAKSPVTASVSEDTVDFTSKKTGTAGNLAFTASDSGDFALSPGKGSLTGGANEVTTTEYDAGSVDAAVGNAKASSNWGKGSTAKAIAADLASSLNAEGKGAFTATAKDDVITITTKSGSTPSVAAGVKDEKGFDPASFAASTD
jgi:hypothetical protein